MKTFRIVFAGVAVSSLITVGSFLSIRPAVAANAFQSGHQARSVDGCNIYRFEDTLVVYTRISGQKTAPTNQYGFEIAVVRGKVVAAMDGRGGMAIPENGAVVSGHGEERHWLIDNVKVGDTATLPDCSRMPHPFSTHLSGE